VFESPRKSERTAAEQNQDDGLFGGNYRLKKLLLETGQPKMRTRRGFTCHFRTILAKRKNHEVGLFRVVDGLF
jgi:hypothetical protein